ncbi:hypothetical protein GOV13_02075 [Candidatus Pacearchaeota archaeon]|nr:hypothetical protein [Candidatus Pacearchaeota archaeon]
MKIEQLLGYEITSNLPPGLMENKHGNTKIFIGEDGEVYLQPSLLEEKGKFLKITQGEENILKYIQ